MKFSLRNTAVALFISFSLFISLGQDCDLIPTEQGVYPEVVMGNPNACDLGDQPGFKIDGYFEGEFKLENSDTTKLYICGEDVEAISDDNVFIVVTKTGNHDHQSFSFHASDGIIIEKVIVKGGSVQQMKSENMNSIANIYDYSGLTVKSDTGLHAPTKDDCKYFDVSHIDFIWSVQTETKPQIQVRHTATADYWMEKIWTINEEALEDELYGLAGENYSTNFQTSVSQQGIQKSNVLINGTINIQNTLDESITLDSISPKIANATLTSISYSHAAPLQLAPGEELICTYTASVTEEIPQESSFSFYGSASVNPQEAKTSIISGVELGITNDVINVRRNGILLGSTSSDMIWLNANAGTFQKSDESSFSHGESMIVETEQTDKDSVLLLVQSPMIELTSQTVNERFHYWSIDKTVSEDKIHIITGESKEVNYTVSVQKDSAVLGYLTEGVINISIPGTKVISTQLECTLDGQKAQFLDLGTNAYVELIPGQITSVSYMLHSSNELNDPTLNVQLIINEESYLTEKEIEVPQNTLMVIENNSVISVDDSYNGLYWEDVDEDSEWTYTRTISGSKSYDLADENGRATFYVDNTAIINETDQSASAEVYVMQYFPLIDQSATATFNRESDWELAVTANENQHEFYGDETFVNYTVKAVKTVSDSDFNIQGSVNISNPSPIEPMTIRVSDIYNDDPVSFNEVGPDDLIVLEPGETIQLTYNYLSEQMPQNPQNQLMVQVNGVQIIQTKQTVNNDTSILNETNSSIEVRDSFGLVTDEPITETSLFIVSRPFEQPALGESDFINGENTQQITNPFVITTSGDERIIPVSTEINRYVPQLEKHVSTDMVKQYDWDISKQVSDEELHLFAGETREVEYTVSVVKKDAEILYVINGSISVFNPNPNEDLFVEIDEVVDGNEIRVDGLDEYGYAFVPALSTEEFTYELTSSAKPEDGTAITLMDYYYNYMDLTESYSFSGQTTVSREINKLITVSDSYDNKIWTNIENSTDFNYTRLIDCSDLSETDFTDGIHQFSVPNTATIVELDKSAQANVNVNCYAPVYSQSASGTFKECYEWTAVKTSDSTSFTATEGEAITIPFEIMVDAEAIKTNYHLNGSIDIYNPHPDKVMELEVYDYFNSQEITLPNTLVTIAPQASIQLTFNQDVSEGFDNYNDAQIYFNGIDFYFGDDVIFEKEAESCNQEITLEDNMLDYSLGTVNASDDLPVYFTYDVEMIPEFNGSPEIISNVVTLLTDQGTELTTSTCEITMNVVQIEDPVVVPDPEDENGQGCTLTPGYWKTHNLYSGKYDLKWTNLPDMDEDGVLEYENELFFLSGLSYHDVISSPTRSESYIILARAYGAANLNILAGADNSDVIDEMTLAETLLAEYTQETAELNRNAFVSTAHTLDQYNNGIIGPGHCNDSDRKSLSMLNNKVDEAHEAPVTIDVFPNPSVDEANFNIAITEASHVKLEIYDAMGNIIEVLYDANVECESERSIQIPFLKEPGKVYFYRLIINGTTESGTLIPG